MGKAATPVEIPEGAIVTYQHNQYRKCGKASCGVCRNGGKHGPYSYAYWHDPGTVPLKYGQGFRKGRLRSKYIGKTSVVVQSGALPAPDTRDIGNVV